jgi:uncharacterized protein YjbI with pentapeptide repeats
MANAAAKQPVACPHLEAVGTRWGDPISAERQAELQSILDAWAAETDHDNRLGPFDAVPITGADVRWLQEKSGRESLLGAAPSLHLEGADLHGAHLEGADLGAAQLEGADLGVAHVEWVRLGRTQLERTHLGGVHLEWADLGEAHLEGAVLREAHLEVVYLREAHLEGADLRYTTMDSKTNLRGAELAKPLTTLERLFSWLPLMRRTASASLGDIRWGGLGTVDLTSVPWESVQRLGDERSARLRDGADKHEAVVRAYRQLVAQLRAQGLSEVADRFALRAQIRQRAVLLRTFRLPQYLFSWFLAILAGYGFRPGRTIFWYLAIVLGFMSLYLHFGVVDGHPFRPLEALVFSLTSFHGRGFFPGGLHLDDPVTVLAAGEAVLGLLVEISFIATFTQRFFGAR